MREVEQHEVRLGAGGLVERLAHAARRHGLEALTAQGLRERLADRRLVLDEEDPLRGHAAL
jgi:hypothetical protein